MSTHKGRTVDMYINSFNAPSLIVPSPSEIIERRIKEKTRFDLYNPTCVDKIATNRRIRFLMEKHTPGNMRKHFDVVVSNLHSAPIKRLSREGSGYSIVKA